MGSNYWSVTLTVGGIFIGWLLTQVGDWRKGKKEDNRIKKQVLFNLLEINFLLQKIMHGSILNIDAVSEKVFEAIPGLANNAVNQLAVKQGFQSSFAPLLKEVFTAQLADIDKTYNASILSLAPVDPVIAYYLYGKTAAIKTMESVIGGIIERMGVSGDSDEISHMQSFFSNEVKNRIYTDSVKDIKELTIDLAGKISLYTKWKIRRIINKPFDLEDADRNLLEMVAMMATNLQAPVQ